MRRKVRSLGMLLAVALLVSPLTTPTAGADTGDALTIAKDDIDGHAGDTRAAAVNLPSGSTRLRFTVRNSGTTALTTIEVTDAVVSGSGTVSGLTCDFSGVGGPGTGTSWDGPLQPNTGFSCTATLSGVFGTHQDRATVTAVGQTPVSASNDYWATGPAAATDLALTKTIVAPGPRRLGDRVVFRLAATNSGNVPAAAGWSITEILPAGLRLVSMEGAGFRCNGVICEALAALGPGATSDPVTVTTTVDPAVSAVSLHNVAYVSPAAGDIAERNPLAVPDTTTDTDATPTNNDAQARVSLSAPVSVGDRVWRDDNRNGLQDITEPGLANVTVQLTSVDGVRTTTTDANGYYWFDGVSAGQPATITVTPPSGYAFTTRNAGGDASNDPTDATDSDADERGEISFTAPAAGANQTGPNLTDNPGLDAGLVQYNLQLTKTLTAPGPFYPGSTVTFSLTPRNTGPAPALAGWTVTEVPPAGISLVQMTGPGYTCAGTTCTAAAALPAGADAAPITVTGKVNPGIVGTVRNVAYVAPGADDAAGEAVPLVIPPAGTDTATTPTDNDADATVTVSSLVSVGGRVWYDTNRNGIRDDVPAAPVPQVTVRLLDANGAELQTTRSGADGSYHFTDLTPAARYLVDFVAPAGNIFTTAGAGSDRRVDSDPDPATGRAPVTAPASGTNRPERPDDPSIDAGLVSTNLTLTMAATSTGPYLVGSTPQTSSVVTWTLTPHNAGPSDARAGWSVTEVLADGLELVSMSGAGYDCAGLTCTAQARLAARADGPVITVTARLRAVGALRNVAYLTPAPTDQSESVPLGTAPRPGADTNATPTDNDASAVVTAVSRVSIGGRVWWDADRNGLRGAGEAPVAGVPVSLLDGAGAELARTVTDRNGHYHFVDLTPGGGYGLRFARPAGAWLTTADAGDDAADSDPAPDTGEAQVTAPAAGANAADRPDVTGLDAGLVSYNLVLGKTTDTASAGLGAQVRYTLTPRNEGPTAALAGWSVTEVLPPGLQLVSMSGAGYACAGVTCTASAPLPPRADGPVMTVVARVTAAGKLRNLAYLAPAAADVPESIPWDATPGSDPDATASDNDAAAVMTATQPASEQPTVKPAPTRPGPMPNTGADLAWWPAAVGLLSLLVGVRLVAGRRGR